jgi:inner membrane protein
MNTVWVLAPLLPLFPESNLGVLCAVAALGSLLPDLDASESKIKHLKLIGTGFKPFLLPALVVSRTDQHRGLLHSLWGLGMAGFVVLCAMPWLGLPMGIALVLGYASHLITDSATKSGIRLFYPSARRYHALPKILRISTGSLAEEALLPFLASGIFLLLMV